MTAWAVVPRARDAGATLVICGSTTTVAHDAHVAVPVSGLVTVTVRAPGDGRRVHGHAHRQLARRVADDRGDGDALAERDGAAAGDEVRREAGAVDDDVERSALAQVGRRHAS